MPDWIDMRDAPRDGTPILVISRVHGVMEARFEPGEWSDSTPDHHAEYSGAVWVCGDDFMQIEVEEFAEHDCHPPYDDGELIGWLPRDALPLTVLEEMCPGHIASEHDKKVCGLCGTHVDSLRPDEEPT